MHFPQIPFYARSAELLKIPFERILESPAWGKALALLGILLENLWSDAFTVIFVLLTISNFLDYRFGVKAAEAKDEYNPLLAEYGWHSKLVGLSLVLLIRGLEWWGAEYFGVATRGVVAVAVTLALLSKDLKSMEHHRVVLGAEPIPIITHVVRWLDELADRFLPGSVEDFSDDEDTA